MSKKITCFWLLPLIPALAQQPKFERGILAMIRMISTR